MSHVWSSEGYAGWNAHRGHGGAPGHSHAGHGHGGGETGRGPAAEHPRSPDADGREVQVHVDLLEENRRQAGEIRRRLDEAGIFSVNLMSSPGSGKTALLESTLPRLTDLRVGVIEGDIETTADADRLSRFDIEISQINTGPFGGDCHLAAPLIERALGDLDLDELDLLFVENVGNLVCPAEFDIGENRKVVLLSVAEGEDKPLKYPLMFRQSDLAVVTKVDLLPHLDVDIGLIERNIRDVHPEMPVIRLSGRTGQGVDGWIDWLRAGIAAP